MRGVIIEAAYLITREESAKLENTENVIRRIKVS